MGKGQMRTVVGIDYSMTSPAVCVHVGDHWNVDNCKFFFLISKKKHRQAEHPTLVGAEYPEWTTNEERFAKLSEFIIDIINAYRISNQMFCEGPIEIAIEGYSYGSTGEKLFQIAENTGVLKHIMWKGNYPFVAYAPKDIKKFATGNGNAGKDLMHQAFVDETGIDFKEIFGLSEKQWNPSSDIVDAYYIAKRKWFDDA